MYTDTLKVACKRAAIECDAGPDTCDDRIEVIQNFPATRMDFGLVSIQLHVTLLDVQKKHFVTTVLSRFHDTSVAVEFRVTCQQSDFQPIL